MSSLAVIILAAGQGVRMRSKRPKVLHSLAGTPLLQYPLDVAASLGAARIVCVLGHGRDAVEALIKAQAKTRRHISVVHQPKALGTADAVKYGLKGLRGFDGDVLILYGDVPLIEKTTLSTLIRFHKRGQYDLSFLTATLEEPKGYGRVIRSESGDVTHIIEEVAASPMERRVGEVNSGIYLLSKKVLARGLSLIKKNRKKGEYFLTDLIGNLTARGHCVGGYEVKDPVEVLGVNSRVELAFAESVMRYRINQRWMEKGVTLVDPDTVYIERSVRLSPDVTIGPHCALRGQTSVQSETSIDVGAVITDCTIGKGVHIGPYCVLESSIVKRAAQLGPFARVRPDSEIGIGAKVGNFVELKKTQLGDGAKANHLTYLGDSAVGEKANIGAGTITCNYDGFAKHRTQIGARSFIGSDVQLVAPVRLGTEAWVGAGTTVTKNVPPGALAVSRAEQVTIKGWVSRRKRRKK